MAREEFENYGIRAGQEILLTELAGRYPSQVEAEKQILVDVLEKLDIGPSNRLLEIGCGPGQILIPLSFLVSEATGVDHPMVCSVLEKRYQSDNLTLMSGNFLDLDFKSKTFDRVLCYSVLSTLPVTEIDSFIQKALGLLEPGGRLLFGDLANVDKKSRFVLSDSGRQFEELWHTRNLSATTTDSKSLKIDTERIVLTDEIITSLLMLIRELGFHCYLLPQPENLPWGRTREDLLVIRPE